MKANTLHTSHPHGDQHELYMRRALELAKNGTGRVSPNPLVGCVIVHEGRIIGEGWHREYGGPHAEVNAIKSVKDKSLLEKSILYVSLEPCSHTGKTPPCADLLIRHRIPTVVICNQDPNPVVAGNGIQKLREAGADVITGVLHRDGYELNRRFFTYMLQERPYIILKWAQTSDGFIARENGDSKWISDLYSRQITHKWRCEEDAIMIASGTARADNPLLTVRNWTGRDPLRVVIDRHLSLPRNLNLFDGNVKTVCYNLLKDESSQNISFIKLPQKNFLESLVLSLYEQKIQSVIVEGGAQLLSGFAEAGLWDEARIFVSPKMFLKGISAPALKGALKTNLRLMDDWLKILHPIGEETMPVQ